ncbi:MAG: hypothetical protein L6R42_005159 [Xanthoria sp. 1 TBL-2021]|nr:MAG: hypothetical protein L6R42_005159 [Xanthoria sp. 1 TBL-2021]
MDRAAPASCPLDTRSLPLKTLATISHPSTGLHLEIQSTEAAFQFYTGDGLYIPEVETEKGTKIPSRGKRSGIAIEPSRYVDCAGREEWRGMCKIRRGQLWGARRRVITHHQMKIARIVAIARGVPILAPIGKPGLCSVFFFSRLAQIGALPVDTVSDEPDEGTFDVSGPAPPVGAGPAARVRVWLLLDE